MNLDGVEKAAVSLDELQARVMACELDVLHARAALLEAQVAQQRGEAVPRVFRRASWRGTTGSEALCEVGLSFDVVGGDVARLVLTFESARALVESLQDVLVRPEAPAGLDEVAISDEAQARVNLWRAETARRDAALDVSLATAPGGGEHPMNAYCRSDYSRVGCVAQVAVSAGGYGLTIFAPNGVLISSYGNARDPKGIGRMVQEWCEGKAPSLHDLAAV